MTDEHLPRQTKYPPAPITDFTIRNGLKKRTERWPKHSHYLFSRFERHAADQKQITDRSGHLREEKPAFRLQQ